jgi:predicted nucleic acid-binding protein
MVRTVKVYLDSSALFASIWSAAGGARMIIRLGEAGALQIFVRSQVLSEVESALRRKAPETLGFLALLLDRSCVSVLSQPDEEIVKTCMQIVQHPGDARVLAASWSSDVDYFVTLDKKHFLENLDLLQAAQFQIGTPGDFLAWFRTMLQ